MKKITALLMLFAVAVLFGSAGEVFAEEMPEDEQIPELYKNAVQTAVFDTGTVYLEEEPEPEPCE